MSADGLPNYDHCRARQRDRAHEVRETEKAAMTGDPAAAVLYERLGGTLAEVRACAAGHASGAFPDQTMRGKAEAYKARILGIAEEFDKAGFRRVADGIRRVADGIRRVADGTVECVVRPGLTGTTHKSEQGMREFVRDRGSSPMLVSAPGRRRYSDGKGCRSTRLNKGLDPFHEMGAALGVEPGREWAQVRTEGERAGMRGAPGRGAMPAGWRRRPARIPRGRIPRFRPRRPMPRPRRPMPECRPRAEPARRGATAAARRPKAPRSRARGVLRHRPPPTHRPPPRRPPRACQTCSPRIPLPPAPPPPRRRAGPARRQQGGRGTR